MLLKVTVQLWQRVTSDIYISPHSEHTVSSSQPHDQKQTLLTYYLHSKLGPVVRPRGHVFDLAQRKHPVDHFAKHDVFAVQEVALGGGDEELYTASVQNTHTYILYRTCFARMGRKLMGTNLASVGVWT